MNKKDLLAKTLFLTGILSTITALCNFKQVRVLAYHRIVDGAEEKSYGSDIELISASSQEFEWQISYLCANYNVISLHEILDSIEGNIPLPDNSVVITFDDGFNDNYTNAYPILKKYDVPATIFLSTGYMDMKHTFWFDRVVYLIKKIKLSEIVLNSGAVTFTLGKKNEERQLVAEDILLYMKKVPDEIRRNIIQEIESIAEMDNQTGPDWSYPLTWKQVREMSDNRIEFGSHTVTHPILSRLSGDKLLWELTESKKNIEEALGIDCYSLAYPVGGNLDYNEKVVDLVYKSGYKLAFTYTHGVDNKKNIDRYRMKRLHVERYTSREYFASMLALPSLFC